jgi:deoxyadenosine/deoxycytidine kinase
VKKAGHSSLVRRLDERYGFYVIVKMLKDKRILDRINRIYWIIESMPEAWTQKNQSRYVRDAKALSSITRCA